MRNITLLIIFCLILVTPLVSHAGDNHWTSTGPGWANSSQVIVDPTNHNRVYGVGADHAAGIFVSNDGGFSWNPANDGLGLVTDYTNRISTFCMDPIQTNTLYCSITSDSSGGENYIFRSVDAGLTWQRIMEDIGSRIVRLNAIDAYDGHVYVGAETQLYRSEDGGKSWFLAAEFSNIISTLALNPTDPNELYVGIQGVGLKHSINGGSDFSPISYFTGQSVYHVGFHQVGSSNIVTTGVYANGLSMSFDNGMTWQRRDDGLPSLGTRTLYPHKVVFSNVDTGTAYCAIALGGVFKTEDLGLHWELASTDIQTPGGHPVEEIMGVGIAIYDQDGQDVVFSATSIGIHRSDDGAETWNTVGIPAQRIDCISYPESEASSGFCGTSFGISAFEDGQWSNTSFIGDNGRHVSAMAIHPTNSEVVLAGVANSFGFLYLVKSIDGGLTWHTVFESEDGLFYLGSVTQILFDEADPSRVFVTWYSGDGGGMLVSTDGGNSFSQDPTLLQTNLTGIVQVPLQPSHMFTCSYFGQVYDTTNGGTTWEVRTSTGELNTTIAIDPQNPHRLYIGTLQPNSPLIYSLDGAQSWNVSNIEATRVTDIAFAHSNMFVAAGPAGVLRNEGDDIWENLNEGLGGQSVLCLEAIEGPYRTYLRIGTSGASVMEYDLLGPSSVHDNSVPLDVFGLKIVGNRIQFSLSRDAATSLRIFDVRGRLVKNLEAGYLSSGGYEVVWNQHDTTGKTVASGLYFVVLKSGNDTSRKKLTLVR